MCDFVAIGYGDQSHQDNGNLVIGHPALCGRPLSRSALRVAEIAQLMTLPSALTSPVCGLIGRGQVCLGILTASLASRRTGTPTPLTDRRSHRPMHHCNPAPTLPAF